MVRPDSLYNNINKRGSFHTHKNSNAKQQPTWFTFELWYQSTAFNMLVVLTTITHGHKWLKVVVLGRERHVFMKKSFNHIPYACRDEGVTTSQKRRTSMVNCGHNKRYLRAKVKLRLWYELNVLCSSLAFDNEAVQLMQSATQFDDLDAS